MTDSFTETVVDLSTAGKDGKPTTLGEIMKQVMVKHSKVKVEASSNQKTRQTTFHLKSESAKELDKAKRMLVALISPQVSHFVIHRMISSNHYNIGYRHFECTGIDNRYYHRTKRCYLEGNT